MYFFPQKSQFFFPIQRTGSALNKNKYFNPFLLEMAPSPLAKYLASVTGVMLDSDEETVLVSLQQPQNNNILSRFASDAGLRVVFVVKNEPCKKRGMGAEGQGKCA